MFPGCSLRRRRAAKVSILGAVLTPIHSLNLERRFWFRDAIKFFCLVRRVWFQSASPRLSGGKLIWIWPSLVSNEIYCEKRGFFPLEFFLMLSLQYASGLSYHTFSSFCALKHFDL